QFEPLAFGLERYLADGTYSEVDYLGNALREDGAIMLPGEAEPQSFTSSREMMELLAGSDGVRQCLTKKGAQFAIARPLIPSDNCSIQKVMESFDASDGSWRDLVAAIALSPGFRSIRVES
ncbi:MAG: DUF1585 domain-containing protein, partial [Nannocystaceae bacterium]|nr:DUF1585 domain-containing protein [Nannocystaceae bacterium]